MSEHDKSQTLQTATMSVTTAPHGILQRKCASCGNHTIAGGKCVNCKGEKGIPQRKSLNDSKHLQVPPIVNDVLNSSGQPLDKSTRAFFEPRFGYDFSRVPVSSAAPPISYSRLTVSEPTDIYEQEADRVADSIMLNEKRGNETSSTSKQQNEKPDGKFDLSRVRVHTDARAADSARAVNAAAYAVGHNIVFGAGQFAPETHKGRRLIAHELTHVLQQTGAKSSISAQPSIQRMPEPQVMRTLLFDSTVEVCHRELVTRNFQVSQGGVRVVIQMNPHDTGVPNCKSHQFWVSLTKVKDNWFDDDIASCQAETVELNHFPLQAFPLELTI